jgi:hypothetical protein
MNDQAMGPIKLYVGNVPTSARNSELKELFEKFGKVVECDILKEFAFVHMESDNDAKAAIAGLNDSLWKGSRLRVEISTTKTSKGEPAAKRGDFNGGRSGHRGGFAADRGSRGGYQRGGGFQDKNAGFDRNGGRGGFQDRGKFQDRNGSGGGGGGMRNGFQGHRGGGFGDHRGGGGGRGGRGGGPMDGRGDARTMSRGGYGDRFGAPQQRRENGAGGGPMRENRFNGGGGGAGGSNYGRPYPDQQGFNGRPGGPMRADYGHGDNYGMRPPMPVSNGFGNGPPPAQDFYNGNGQQQQQHMGNSHFNGGGFGNGVGGGDHYMHGTRAPMNGAVGGPMGGVPPMGGPNNFNFQQAPNPVQNGGQHQPQR